MSNNYLDDWDRRRRAVYERDNYTCQNCGWAGGPVGDIELHCHYVVPKSWGGTHRTENLVTLCEDCHDAVHNRSAVAPTAGQDHTGDGPTPATLRRLSHVQATPPAVLKGGIEASSSTKRI